ncbi:MAG: preprotein translocase subunit YajC, partial [Dictyoglomus sp.]
MEQTVNLISIILVWVVFLGIFYFMLIIPQKREAKKRQEMLDSLKVGDK